MKNIKQLKEHVLLSMKFLDSNKPESAVIMSHLNGALKEIQKVESKIISKNNFRLNTQKQQEERQEKEKVLGLKNTGYSLNYLDEMIKQEQEKLKQLQTDKQKTDNIEEFLID